MILKGHQRLKAKFKSRLTHVAFFWSLPIMSRDWRGRFPKISTRKWSSRRVIYWIDWYPCGRRLFPCRTLSKGISVLKNIASIVEIWSVLITSKIGWNRSNESTHFWIDGIHATSFLYPTIVRLSDCFYCWNRPNIFFFFRSLKSKIPLPAYMPSARSARTRLIRHRRKEAKSSQQFLRFKNLCWFAMASSTEEIIEELEHLNDLVRFIVGESKYADRARRIDALL